MDFYRSYHPDLPGFLYDLAHTSVIISLLIDGKRYSLSGSKQKGILNLVCVTRTRMHPGGMRGEKSPVNEDKLKAVVRSIVPAKPG